MLGRSASTSSGTAGEQSKEHVVVRRVAPAALDEQAEGDQLVEIGELNGEDRAHLLSVIDAFVTKNRLPALASGNN